jgi:copper chaperone CopZ
MKTVTTIFMSLLFVAVFAPEVKAQQPSGDKVVTIEANMSCDGCKKSIESGLAKEAGVKSVVADSKTKMVTVTYDESKVSDASLVKSIEKMGYKAKVSDGKKSGEASKKSGGGC